MFLPAIFLRKCNASTYGNLGAYDAIPAEESRGEDVHRATLTMRHAALATEKFGNDALDGTASHDGERMTTVRGNDTVVFFNAVFKTNRYGFLKENDIESEKPSEKPAYLTNS